MKNKLEELRKNKGLSQEQLAEKVLVSRQTIISLEKGRYNPSLDLAFRLSKFFNVPIEDIFIYNSTFAAQNRQVHLNIIGQTRKPLL